MRDRSLISATSNTDVSIVSYSSNNVSDHASRLLGQLVLPHLRERDRRVEGVLHDEGYKEDIL